MKKIIFSFLLLSIFTTSTSFSEDFDLRKSYAVIWTVDTTKEEDFKHAIADQATRLLELWKEGIVENVYFDNDNTVGKKNKKGDLGKVIFFIKAKSEADAAKILDAMPFIKEKLAKYTLYPVGVLWLKQY